MYPFGRCPVQRDHVKITTPCTFGRTYIVCAWRTSMPHVSVPRHSTMPACAEVYLLSLSRVQTLSTRDEDGTPTKDDVSTTVEEETATTDVVSTMVEEGTDPASPTEDEEMDTEDEEMETEDNASTIHGKDTSAVDMPFEACTIHNHTQLDYCILVVNGCYELKVRCSFF